MTYGTRGFAGSFAVVSLAWSLLGCSTASPAPAPAAPESATPDAAAPVADAEANQGSSDAGADGALASQLSRTEGYAYKDGAWGLVARQEHEYERGVRVRTRSSFTDDGKSWVESSTTTYEYVAALLTSTRTKFVDSGLYVEDETRNFYDSANRLTRQESGYLETPGSAWVWDTRVALDYDASGRLLREEAQHLFSATKEWSPEARTTHEYDAKGVRTGTRVYLYAVKRDTERHAFVYDADARLDTETVFRLPPNAAEVPEKRFVSIYR